MLRGSVNSIPAPAGVIRRPPGITSTSGSAGSTPAYFSASPVGALARHFPGVGAGKRPVYGAHAARCGIAFQSRALGHSYGVVASAQAAPLQS